MPTIQYPNNSNSDTAFVTDDQGNRTRAVKTATIDGTIHYPKNSNSTDCYVTVDGKKQRALMTADISSEGTLEYPTNSNSTKGYVTVDGKKQRVVLTASLAGGGGSTPVIEELNVTPSTSAQTITAPTGTDGYSPVKVSAVTSSIDANIVSGNIKNGVSILGVTGNYTGNTPTGTMYIISNGTYNVSDKAIANVNVPTAAPAHYIEKSVDANGKLIGGSSVIDLTGVTDVGNYQLYYAYYQNTNITGNINISSLVQITGTDAFSNCFYGTGITGFSLSVQSISGSSALYQAFYICTQITNLNLSYLVAITNQKVLQYSCRGCTRLASVNLDSLKIINGSYVLNYCFRDCTSLQSLSFPALSSNAFGSYTNQFSGMLQGVTGCTVHFPSNLQSVIGSWTDVTGGFAGTSTTVLFDLPATVILTGANSVNYERSPKDDTATALAWRVQDTGTAPNLVIDWTPYYTSGTTDPAVSDTIYSDAACTTPVTTISSIA